jgi:DNA-binding NarL/FixJ family response regulator
LPPERPNPIALSSLNAEELVELLSSVENNEAPFSPGLAAKLLEEFRRDDRERRLPPQQEPEDALTGPLTGRQLEILEMVAGGKTYKEVGAALEITERTVKYCSAPNRRPCHSRVLGTGSG